MPTAPSKRRNPSADRSTDTGAEKALPPVEPLTPRRGLFVALSVVFALWVGCLLAMYFLTVRGQHEHKATPDAPVTAPV